MTDRYDNLAKCMECTPEEIPALIQQHSPWNGRDMCNDTAALAAEVERLRLDRDDIEHAYKFARDKAKLLERQAVVAWLRLVTMDARDLYHAIADHIERGEHRRGEEGT